jgi:hypothetical protein
MKFLKNIPHILILFFLICSSSCKKEDAIDTIINAGNDPNFNIVINSDIEYIGFNRKVMVFGIAIYAVPGIDDKRLLHAANIMAQYLDNDENGIVDNELVLEKMIANNAFMFMWDSESDFNNITMPDNAIGQDLGNDETVPEWHTNGQIGRFDASLEEVWHIITSTGYAYAYPDVFGEETGTSLSNAMDIARGGNFTTIPNPYPSEAWYTYDDETCTYECMNTEYIYWSMTSILGAQTNRLDEISQEWDLNTVELVQNNDTAVYALLTNLEYKFPIILPDGTYRQ